MKTPEQLVEMQKAFIKAHKVKLVPAKDIVYKPYVGRLVPVPTHVVLPASMQPLINVRIVEDETTRDYGN